MGGKRVGGGVGTRRAAENRRIQEGRGRGKRDMTSVNEKGRIHNEMAM